MNLATLYIDQVHGNPDLDLELIIDGTNITANIYSSNDYGGTFGYPEGIVYNISAGGTGFNINTGSFSYTTSGTLIKSQSGTIGAGVMGVICTCNGGGNPCYSSDDTAEPVYNASKSSGIDTTKLTINSISGQFMSGTNHMNNTLLISYGEDVGPPVISGFTGDYMENFMSAIVDLGIGTFQNFKVEVKREFSQASLLTVNKNYNGWTFTDTELLTIYNGLNDVRGEQTIALKLTLTTSDGEDINDYTIKVGGTTRVNNGIWKRTVPYILGLNRPSVAYVNIDGTWKRGNP